MPLKTRLRSWVLQNVEITKSSLVPAVVGYISRSESVSEFSVLGWALIMGVLKALTTAGSSWASFFFLETGVILKVATFLFLDGEGVVGGALPGTEEAEA